MNRLHPFTIVIEFLRMLRRLIAPLVVFLILRLQGGGGDTTELLIAAIGLLSVFGAIAQYYFTKYGVERDQLVIRSGVFVKQERTIPLDRIQNINLTRTVAHRMFGLADVQIETASGQGAEASLSALSFEAAERLKSDLMGRPASADKSPSSVADSAPPAVDERVVYQASVRELLLAGATENRALAIALAIFGLWATFSRGNEAEAALELAERSSGFMAYLQSAPVAIVAVMVTLAFILFGWAVSIVSTFLTYGGFILTLGPGRLRRRYGLLNVVENVVPIRRIQVVRWKENPIQRRLRVAKVFVETAGGFGIEGANNNAASTSTSLLSPLTSRPLVPTLAAHALPQLPPQEPEFRRASPRAVWKGFRIGSILITLAIVAFSAVRGWEFLWALPAGWAFAYGWSVLRYRALGWAILGGLFAVRGGVWARNYAVVPGTKVQMVTWSQTPLQRRLRLANVGLVTAASTPAGRMVEAQDLDVTDAKALIHAARHAAAGLGAARDGV